MVAENRSQDTLDPEHPCELFVDGEASLALGMAFCNGGLGRHWTVLAPGEEATDYRTGISFVSSPGDHVIVLRGGGTELARATVHVTP
jgi:hypothetical protein